jgi:diaminopimelate decarboxylase
MFARFQGTQVANASGRLTIGGLTAEHLASTFGTPLYVIDGAEVRERCREFLAAVKPFGGRVAYAAKANPAIGVLKLMLAEGCDVDVASEGELEAALRAGFPAKRVHLHGNAKSDTELRRAVEVGIGAVVIDCIEEISRLAKICEQTGSKQRVLLRLAPGVDPVTHEAIRTGQEDSKFGLNISSGAALEAAQRVAAEATLRLSGVHVHVGSQLMDAEAIAEGARRAAEFAISARDTFDNIEEVIAGGGFGIAYVSGDNPCPIVESVRRIESGVRAEFERAGLPMPTLAFEPGRYLVGTGGVTIYRIIVRKSVPVQSAAGERSYLSVDGGMADNPRPQMYGAKYTAMNASKLGEPHDTEFRVAGRHCETDTLIAEAMLPASTGAGDLLCVQGTGAYNFAMASNYNRYPRPAMVLVEDGEARLIVRRETLDDIFRCEEVC